MGLLIPLRKPIVLAAVLVAFIAIYAAAGFFLVPRVARSYAQDFVTENYGRTAEIGEVRFNPFTLTLEVKKKERTPELLAVATAVLETELIREQPVPQLVLEELGTARAQSIQDALLGGGQVDPGRVFVITADARPAVAAESRVRMELSLK